MSISSSAQYALGVSGAVAILVGCSSGGSQLAPSRPMQQNAARSSLNTQSIGHLSTLVTKSGVVTVHQDHSRSRVDPSAYAENLLYISDSGTNDVNVYSFPKGTLKGTLTGFSEPQGECRDKTDNVWITNTGTSEIIKYAHGGTSPIATLEDPGQYPVGCSVNVNTGALAVTNIVDTSGGPGSLSIYRKAKGTPTTYYDSNFSRMYFPAYDNQGNVFVDGTDANGVVRLAELPKGSATFTDLTLSGATINFPGTVAYDGVYIAIGDQSPSAGGGVLYQTSPPSGGIITVVGTTLLTGAVDCVQDFVNRTVPRKKVVCPDAGNADWARYKYPAGGSPTLTVTGLSVPIGSAISEP